MANGLIYVDMDHVRKLLDQMDLHLNRRQMAETTKKAVRQTVKDFRTNRAKNGGESIMYKGTKKRYVLKKTVVNKPIGAPSIHTSNGGIQCSIPIREARGKIGSHAKAIYKSKDGLPGWASLTKKYRIHTKMLNGKDTVLPKQLPARYGGQPPFINTKAPKLNNIAFTREGKARLPIRPVTGIAIPQMPVHKNVEPTIRTAIADSLYDNLQTAYEEKIRKIQGSI